MNLNELSEILKEHGIAGAGGAGFPAYAKLNERADNIILNCAECEPLLKLHRQLLEKNVREILSTLVSLAEVLKVEHILVGVKKSYTQTVKALNTAMVSFPKIQIALLEETYPAGDEVVLIYETTGKIVPPGKIPINIGVIVYNVETVFNMYQALNKKMPVIGKYVTIAGEVKNPITKYVPLGISVGELVESAGGSMVDDPVVIVGGPMTGKISTQYDVITKTTNGIIVFNKDHQLIHSKRKRNEISMKRAMASCCQCEFCTDLCPRNLLGHPIAPHLFMRAATSGITKDVIPYLNTRYCSSCGVCELYSCSQGLAPRTLINEFKLQLKNYTGQIPKEVEVIKPKKNREYRKVPMERLLARLGLSKYDVPAPIDHCEIETNSVRLLLSQHIGVPAVVEVKVGDKVQAGQRIAHAAEGVLSLPVHASIDGMVSMINEREIIINGY